MILIETLVLYIRNTSVIHCGTRKFWLHIQLFLRVRGCLKKLKNLNLTWSIWIMARFVALRIFERVLFSIGLRDTFEWFTEWFHISLR